MKRAQINRHRIIWALMVPALIVIFAAALLAKPAGEAPTNDTLPTFLSEDG